MMKRTRETKQTFATEAAKWKAVGERDANADGRFFYSVKTTGVYCRPSCASRPARRENVAFHATPIDAEAAGFRACKRCRPNDLSLAGRRADAIARACRLIEQSEDGPDLDAIARAASMTRFHFQRVFKAVTGLTPKAYAQLHRASRVRETLKRSSNVTDAIYESGFNSSGRFYATSDEMLGMTPSAFREGGAHADIRFAVGETSLGSILVAATQKGLCSILFGNDPDALVKDLQSRFPKANLHGGDRQFEEWVAVVVGFVEAPRLGLDLPLDVRGTVFQRRVWKALQQIPVGTTASYSEIAQKVGLPGGSRAIAQACAANPLAVAIPCHRVVRSDGGLSGYRWGVDRKKTLLEREGARERAH
jgi:AraC family transcriptional regulator, regulatory protein of adaptative response / methylated-DNA-[protein]-cysteine methyltransferase